MTKNLENNNKAREKKISKFLESIGNTQIAKALRKYGLLAMLVVGSKYGTSQIDNSRPIDSVQITQINNLGSVSFDIQGDSTIQAKLYQHAIYMQQCYGVHIDLVHTIVRVNYLATNLIESGSSTGRTDINAMRTWQKTYFPLADKRDVQVGYFTGNNYGGGGLLGEDAFGYRLAVVDNFNNTYLTAHEICHTFGPPNALDGAHTQHKDSISFTAKNLNTGVISNGTNGASAGKPGTGSGPRLRVMSVSDDKNTGNPINGGNGNYIHTAKYWGTDYKITIPYAGMSNDTAQGNVTNGIAGFYNGTTTGRFFRYEYVAPPAQPVTAANGDKISISNIAVNYDSLYVANTTDTTYDHIYKTKRNVRAYLYLVSNQGNDQFVWHGDVSDTVDLSDEGLNVNDIYIMKTGTFIGNSISNASTPIFAGDTIAPVAIAQNDTIYLDASGNTTADPINIDNGSTDNDTIVSLNLDNTNFTCADIGPNTVQLIVTDAQGNSDTTTATVTVLDTIAPVAFAQNHTAYLNSSGNALIDTSHINASGTDNCGIASDSISQTSFDCTNLGTNNITYYVTDSSGNIDSTASVINVLDTIAPVAFAHSDTTYLDAFGNSTITKSDIGGSGTDNCSIAGDTISQTSFDCTNLGTNNITYYVTDSSGNIDSVVVVETVMDTIKPTVITKNFSANVSDGSPITILPSDVDNGSFDNCSLTLLTVSPNHFTTADAGPNNVWLKGEDSSGNIDSTNATVNLSDVTGIEESPVLSGVSIYPNPTTGIINIKNGKNIAGIAIFDALGRAIPNSTPKDLSKIDLSKLKPGVYYIKLEDEQGRAVTKKVIKQ